MTRGIGDRGDLWRAGHIWIEGLFLFLCAFCSLDRRGFVQRFIEADGVRWAAQRGDGYRSHP